MSATNDAGSAITRSYSRRGGRLLRFTPPAVGIGLKCAGSVMTTPTVGPDGSPGAATHPASGNVTFSSSRIRPGYLSTRSGPGRFGSSGTTCLFYIDMSLDVTHSSKVSSQFVVPPVEGAGAAAEPAGRRSTSIRSILITCIPDHLVG
ncbi:MAG: hypothetical protein M0P17_06270 [Methanoculleus sp.]|nr:hypothetical protein [Methanoculleus sp.]